MEVGKRGGYALFCWDAFFNALLAAVSSKELAYLNAVEMLRALTPEGFVPNVEQGTGRKTYDGSQPPIGSLMIRELYRRFGERWFLEETFDAAAVLEPLVVAGPQGRRAALRRVDVLRPRVPLAAGHPADPPALRRDL